MSPRRRRRRQKISTPELVRRIERRLRELPHAYEVRGLIYKLREAGIVEEFRRGAPLNCGEMSGAMPFTMESTHDAIRNFVKRAR